MGPMIEYLMLLKYCNLNSTFGISNLHLLLGTFGFAWQSPHGGSCAEILKNSFLMGMEECAVFSMHCYRKDTQGPWNTLFQGVLLQYSHWKQSPCSTKNEVNDILMCTGHCAVQILSTPNMKFKSCLHPHNHLFNNHAAQTECLPRKDTLYSPKETEAKQNL